jgi:parallel beta-helix repeat protein
LGASANGIRLENSTGASIYKNLVQGTNADGIALMNGSSDNVVLQNEVYQAGDDSYSDDSYVGDKKQDKGNVFRNNLSLDNAYGRGFVIAGATGDTLEGNVVSGTPGNGIFAGEDRNSGTMPGGGNTIRDNIIMRSADAPIVAPGSNQQNNRTGETGSAKDFADILGFDPVIALKSRKDISPQYQPGTGNGSNNANGVRT